MSRLARNRLWSAAAAATAASLLLLGTSPERRILAAYAVITTVGYGHLLGAARPLERIRRWTPPGESPWLPAAFVAASIATAYLAYRALLAAEPRAVSVLFALSAWHSWENDRALGRAYANRGLPGPMRASPWAALAVAGGAVAAAPFVFGVRRSDLEVALFVLPTTYHLASWLVLTADRMRWLAEAGRPEAASRLRRRVVACHGAALLPAAISLVAPASGPAMLAGVLLSLPVYLFATALHILDTSTRRGWQATPVADGS